MKNKNKEELNFFEKMFTNRKGQESNPQRKYEREGKKDKKLKGQSMNEFKIFKIESRIKIQEIKISRIKIQEIKIFPNEDLINKVLRCLSRE